MAARTLFVLVGRPLAARKRLAAHAVVHAGVLLILQAALTLQQAPQDVHAGREGVGLWLKGLDVLNSLQCPAFFIRQLNSQG